MAKYSQACISLINEIQCESVSGGGFSYRSYQQNNDAILASMAWLGSSSGVMAIISKALIAENVA
jgi:hypothetical protein